MKTKILLIASLFVALGQVAWAQTEPIDLSQGDFTEGFENGLAGWSTSGLYINAYYGVISSVSIQGQVYPTSHTGEYSFKFGAMSNVDGYLVSPEFVGTENGVHVEFYYNAFYAQASYDFQIGTVTDIANVSGTFQSFESVHVDGLLPTGTNPWIKYENDFYGANHIAIKVQSGNHVFVDDFTFSVPDGCGKPNLLSGSATANSMTLNWLGNNLSYELQYIPFDFYSDFEANMNGLSSFDEKGYNNTWGRGNQTIIDNPHGNYSAYSSLVHRCNNYLVSPWEALQGEFSFYVKYENSNDKGEVEPVRCKVYVFLSQVEGIGIDNIGGFVEVDSFTATGNWALHTIDLSAYNGQMGYVIVCHVYEENTSNNNAYYLEIDDISLLNSNGNWTTVSDIQASPYTQEGLMCETYYAVRMRGVCNGGEYSSWTEPIEVTTAAAPSNAKMFVGGQGDNGQRWDVAENWSPSGVPTMSDVVFIQSNAVIPADCVAEASSVSVQFDKTLTIEEGGQLKHDNTGVIATAQKGITAYTDDKDQYYLLASPVVSVTPTVANGILTSEYDLYRFDQEGDAEGKEWLNYETYSFDLASGMGYLYASNTPTALSITGQLVPSSTDVDVPLTYTSGVNLTGWNLVGNPFMCDAYIGRNYYRLAEANGVSELVPALASAAIAPMEGVFVQAADANDHEATFTRTAPRSESVLNMNVIRKGNCIDIARVRFGEGRGLEKFQLNPNHTKVYLQLDEKNYAVVCTDGTIGEIPVSFKAAESGTYTLDFSFENVEFSYLYLIDNLTGSDINLLANSSYSFNAQVTDYAQRFRLVFATGSSVDGESFGFIRDGRLLVLGNEGEAILQILDMSGRMMSSEQFSGTYDKPFDVAPGVYVIRLINGDNVRTQKIVVR